MPIMETADEVLSSDKIGIENTFTPDFERIRQIYSELDKTERTMDLQSYLAAQMDQALGEENKRKAAVALNKDVSLVDQDEAMLFYEQSGESERFALENMRYRSDQSLDYIKNFYKKYLSEKE